MFENVKFASKTGGFMLLEIVIPIAVIALLCLPALALAGDPGAQPSPTLPLPSDFLLAIVLGVAAPLVGYIVNYIGPWVGESVKLVVQTVLAAIAGGIAQAATVGDLGFNDITLQYVLAAIFAAGLAHGWWKAGGINTRLGGGRNLQDDPSR